MTSYKPHTSIAEAELDHNEKLIILMLQKVDRIKFRLSGVTNAEGVTPQQYNILRILRGAGEKGLPTLEIGNRMLEQSPGITRLIDRLELKKLVKRFRTKTDRRMVHCLITEHGNHVLNKLEKPISDFHAEVTADLTDSEKKKFIAYLLKL